MTGVGVLQHVVLASSDDTDIAMEIQTVLEVESREKNVAENYIFVSRFGLSGVIMDLVQNRAEKESKVARESVNLERLAMKNAKQLIAWKVFSATPTIALE